VTGALVVGTLSQQLGHSTKVAKAVEGACRTNRGATVRVLVAALVEAFVNAKLERTDVVQAQRIQP